MEFRVETRGTPELRARLRGLPTELRQRVIGPALMREAQELLTASQALVPVDQGPLRASGQVVGPEWVNGVGTVVVGYGSAAVKYAVSVHENPRSGRTGGVTPSGRRRKTWATTGQWKFLEQPFTERAPRFPDRMRDHVEAGLRGLVG